MNVHEKKGKTRKTLATRTLNSSAKWQGAGFVVGIWFLGLWQTEKIVEDAREMMGFHHNLKKKSSEKGVRYKNSVGICSSSLTSEGVVLKDIQ